MENSSVRWAVVTSQGPIWECGGREGTSDVGLLPVVMVLGELSKSERVESSPGWAWAEFGTFPIGWGIRCW